MSAPDITEQLVRAVVLYALAEFQSGNATNIRVSAEGTSFGVSDDGRGHAVDRTIEGVPYLPFVYTHFEYPFAALEGLRVQLQGIGMSLLNALCDELSVEIRKKTETICLNYRSGHLHDELHADSANEVTGNRVFGKVNPRIQTTSTNVASIESWLLRVLAVNPGLQLHLNGKELNAHPAGAA